MDGKAVKALIETKQEFRKLEMDTDEPDKTVGESIAKANILDEQRAAQKNPIVELALQQATEDPSKEQFRQSLRQKIDELKSESVEEVTKRRVFGARRRFR